MVQIGRTSAEEILVNDPIRIAITAVGSIVCTPEYPEDEGGDKKEDKRLVQRLHLETMEEENPEG